MVLVSRFFRRYRLRLSRLGALAAGGIVFEIFRRESPDTLSAWFEAAAWTVVTYVVVRRLITFAVDSTAQSVGTAARNLIPGRRRGN